MKYQHIKKAIASSDGKTILCEKVHPIAEKERSEWFSELWIKKNENWELLFFSDTSCENPDWSPDGKWISFICEKNLWLYEIQTKNVKKLTLMDQEISHYSWSPDSSLIAFSCKDVDEEKRLVFKEDFHLVETPTKGNQLWIVSLQGKTKKLTDEFFHVGAGDYHPHISWSPDGKQIAFDATTPLGIDINRHISIYIYHLIQKQLEKKCSSTTIATQPYFSPNGQYLAYCQNDEPFRWAGSSVVHVLDVKTEKRFSLAETPNRELHWLGKVIGWSKNSDALYVMDWEGTLNQIYALPIDQSPPVPLERGKLIKNPQLNSSRTYLTYGAENLDKAQEIQILTLSDNASVCVSNFNKEIQKPSIHTELVTWNTDDDLTIEGLLTYPIHYEQGKTYPLLVVLHGGPMANIHQAYIGNPLTFPPEYPIQAFAEAGFAILRPNIRGSSGYGKAFRFAIYEDWGGKDYRDVMKGIDQMIAKGLANPNRLGILGWSYGGYLTSWIITQTNRFKAASIGAGLTNILSGIGVTDIPDFFIDYFGGSLADRADFYLKRSPIFHVRNVTTPTLIQHGIEDKRVPISQGYEFFRALKIQKVPVSMDVYPRMAHHTKEAKFLFHQQQRNLEWMKKYV